MMMRGTIRKREELILAARVPGKSYRATSVCFGCERRMIKSDKTTHLDEDQEDNEEESCLQKLEASKSPKHGSGVGEFGTYFVGSINVNAKEAIQDFTRTAKTEILFSGFTFRRHRCRIDSLRLIYYIIYAVLSL
jgi:hypothetical protein